MPASRLGTITAVAACAFVTCGTGSRADEFLCEEAFVRLQECCPDLHVSRQFCEYDPGCGSPRYPVLTVRESNCLRSASCSALAAAETCKKLEERDRARYDYEAGVATIPGEICP